MPKGERTRRPPSAKGKRRGKDKAHTARSDTQPRRAHAPNKPASSHDAPLSSLPHRRAGLRELLAGIGTPESQAFAPDSFQLEALARLEHEDVLVTAPTGSGKTWIAREEIRRLLAAGKRAWYTSPLKALTNSKYVEFAEEFGAETVGILTGDRKENTSAPLIVGTTEVYRNQLFDALRRGENTAVDLVILDEAHYLADEERGHVWEETIILCPARVRLLLLSATIGNAGELARWIATVRGSVCSVVERRSATGKLAPRPVPLRAAFLFPDGGLAPLVVEEKTDGAPELSPEVRSFLQREGARMNNASPRSSGGRPMRPQMTEMPPADLVSALGRYDLLPAIIFLPTRRRCDESAVDAAGGLRTTGGLRATHHARRNAREEFLREFAAAHPEIRRHRQREAVVRSGVASHHAGHLPPWKAAIEMMMARGLLDAIFATSTVAAGVDFPARTVVLTVADTRTNNGWRALGASEFQQMTGRAGRRGRDQVGFIVVAPGRYQNPQRIAHLLDAKADDLRSQFRATYTTLLNLLDAYGSFRSVREIIERSFAHVDLTRRLARLETERNDSLASIEKTLRAAGYEGTEKMLNAARSLERLASARARVQEALPHTRDESVRQWLDEIVVPGRVVRIGRGGGAKGKRLVFVTERRGESIIGVRETGARATLALDRIGRVFTEIYPLTKAEDAFAAVHERCNLALHEPRRSEQREELDEASELINKAIERIIAEACGEKKEDAAQDVDALQNVDARRNAAETCAHALWRSMNDAERAHVIERDIENLREEVWQPFARRARVLERFGYLDMGSERVTERGRWLADLRVDRPLLVGETLAHNLLQHLDAPALAGSLAAFAADSERSYGELPLSDNLISALNRFEQIAHTIADAEWEHGLEPAPEMNYSAAAAAARWTQEGVKWETLVNQTGAEEGDLFRMLSRVGEALMQIGNLRQSYPEAAGRARATASVILREPVRPDEAM